MNRSLYAKIALGFAALTVLVAGGVSRAAESKNIESVLAAGESHNGIYNRAASVVKIDGTVNGNVFVAGNELSIDGTVNGDVYAAGQNVSIKGKVTGSVHVAAARVDVSGEVGNSLIAAGSSITTASSAKVGRDLLAAGSLVNANAAIGGVIFAGGSEININNNVASDVTLAAERIVIGREAKIGGNLKYNDTARITIANDKNIAGSITKFRTSEESKKNTLASLIGGIVYGVTANFMIGLVLLLLLPGTFVATSQYVQTRAAKSALTGLGFLILTPIAALIVLVTIFGMPLALLIGLTYIQVLVLGGVFVALWVGRKITNTTGTKLRLNVWPLLLGLLILETLKILPVFGGLIGFVVLILGSGALIVRSWDRFSLLSKAQKQS